MNLKRCETLGTLRRVGTKSKLKREWSAATLTNNSWQPFSVDDVVQEIQYDVDKLEKIDPERIDKLLKDRNKPLNVLFDEQIVLREAPRALKENALKIKRMLDCRSKTTSNSLLEQDAEADEIISLVETSVKTYNAPMITESATLNGYARLQFQEGVFCGKALDDRNAIRHFKTCFKSLAKDCTALPIDISAVCYNLGVCYFNLGHWQKALAKSAHAIEKHDTNHLYFSLRSRCYSALQQFYEAGRDAEIATRLKLNPVKIAYHTGLPLQNINEKGSGNSLLYALIEDPMLRTEDQLKLLVIESENIPCISKLNHSMLVDIWRNIKMSDVAKNHKTQVCINTKRFYLIYTGNFELATKSKGKIIRQLKLNPMEWFYDQVFDVHADATYHLHSATGGRYLSMSSSVYLRTLGRHLLEESRARAKFLQRSGIFANWKQESFETMGRNSNTIHYAEGETIALEHTPCSQFSIILSGIASVVKKFSTSHDHVELSTLTTGDVFGENCILKRFESKHTSCLIAQTPVQAVAIDKKQFYASIIDAGKDSIDDQIIAKLKLHAAQQYSDEQIVHSVNTRILWENRRRLVIQKVLDTT